MSAVLGFCSLFYAAHILQCMLGYDTLSILLHAGIARLTFLAYNWIITNDCFNPFGVSSYYGIAHSSNSFRVASDRQ